MGTVGIEWRWRSGRRAYKRVPRGQHVTFMVELANAGATRVRTVA